MTKPSTFDEELPGLVGKIEEILPDGDGHKILVLLERLMTYEDLNDTQQTIVQNCMDALMLRGLLPPGEYLTDVQVFLGSIVGNGEFGNVYKGNWKGGLIAVKKFRPVTPPEHIEGLYREKFMQHVEPFKSFFREMDRWKTVSAFEYVWPFLGCTMWFDWGELTFVFALVSPLAEGHLKFSYIDWRSLTPTVFANYFLDVSSGLQSLHDYGVIHGNICTENILLHRGHCYLIDFCISTSLYSSSDFSFVPAITRNMPLEVIDGSVTQFNKYTDIFKLGCTMYQVLSRTSVIDTQYVRPKSHSGQEWDAIWDLVFRCLSKEPTNRPTACQVVERLKIV